MGLCKEAISCSTQRNVPMSAIMMLRYILSMGGRRRYAFTCESSNGQRLGAGLPSLLRALILKRT